MTTARPRTLLVATLVGTLMLKASAARADDPLPSWNDSAAKRSIVGFVEKVTKPGSPDFVRVPERIAVFDNDGTLWIEQPMSVQLAFALDRQPTSSRPIPGRLSWLVLSSAPTSGTASAAGRRPNRRSACSAV